MRPIGIDGRKAARVLVIVVACAACSAAPAAAKYTFVRAWGTKGHHNGQFLQPWGLAMDNADHVFVTDRGQPSVQEFGSTGHFIRRWSTGLSIPEGDAVTSAGNVFVADSGREAILEFSPSGHLINTWHQNSPFLVNFVAAQGNAVWYTKQWLTQPGDTTYRKGMIQKLGSNHQPIAYGPTPWGIAFSPNGQIYVARPQANDVLDRTTNDVQLHAWGTKGNGPGEFNGPSGIAVDRWGNVYVTDLLNARVEKFAADGTYLDSFGSKGKGDGKLSGPVGIAVDASGNVYVADGDNDRIEEFAPVFPQTRFSLHIVGPQKGHSLPIYYTSSSGYATFQCTVDGGPWRACGTANGADQYVAGIHLKNLREGKHTFEVRATDAAGNTDPTPLQLTFAVDRIPPVLSAPTETLVTGTTATQGQVPVNVAWSATDNYSMTTNLTDELEWRSGTPSLFGAWSRLDGNLAQGWLPNFDFTSFVDNVTPSSATYHEYRVKALDQAGNEGVGPDGSPFRAIVYQDSDPHVTYTGSWGAATEAQYPAAFDGLHITPQAGASASLTFHGSSVAVLQTLNSSIGVEHICVDPGTSSQSCSKVSGTAAVADRVIVFARNHLSSGSHTVRMRDLSGWANLDAFVVLK